MESQRNVSSSGNAEEEDKKDEEEIYEALDRISQAQAFIREKVAKIAARRNQNEASSISNASASGAALLGVRNDLEEIVEPEEEKSSLAEPEESQAIEQPQSIVPSDLEQRQISRSDYSNWMNYPTLEDSKQNYFRWKNGTIHVDHPYQRLENGSHVKVTINYEGNTYKNKPHGLCYLSYEGKGNKRHDFRGIAMMKDG